MYRFLTSLFGTAVLALAALAAVPAQAQTQAYSAHMTAADEVPPNDSMGMGTVDMVYDKASGVLRWSVRYSGLTGPVKAGHIHGPAEVGKNAPVVQPFAAPLESPFSGSATISAAQAADLEAGRWYVNLHTAVHAGGEVRGQVLPAP